MSISGEVEDGRDKHGHDDIETTRLVSKQARVADKPFPLRLLPFAYANVVAAWNSLLGVFN